MIFLLKWWDEQCRSLFCMVVRFNEHIVLTFVAFGVVFHPVADHRNTSKNWVQKRNTSHCGWIVIALQLQFGSEATMGKGGDLEMEVFAEVCMVYVRLCAIARWHVGFIITNSYKLQSFDYISVCDVHIHKKQLWHPHLLSTCLTDPIQWLTTIIHPSLQVKEKTFATRCILSHWGPPKSHCFNWKIYKNMPNMPRDCPLKFAVLSDSWRKTMAIVFLASDATTDSS